MSLSGDMTLVFAAAVAIAVAFAIALLRMTGIGARLADHPNARSLHEVPRPRIGGLAVIPVALAAIAWLMPGKSVTLVLPGAMVFAISLADDVRSRPVAVRLVVHFLAAMLAVWQPNPSGLLVALAIVWSANLYNFMDGADGLAGGMATIGFAALSWIAATAGHGNLAASCLVVAAAAFGFLAWNFPPARVFLGDAGSVPLGFLAGVLSWQGVSEGAWPLAVPVVIFSPFWVDATVTLFCRVVRRERFLEAHRSHYYQRLVLSGWSHRRLAIFSYGLMFACALSAIALEGASKFAQGAIMALWVLAFAALAFLIDRRYARAR